MAETTLSLPGLLFPFPFEITAAFISSPCPSPCPLSSGTGAEGGSHSRQLPPVCFFLCLSPLFARRMSLPRVTMDLCMKRGASSQRGLLHDRCSSNQEHPTRQLSKVLWWQATETWALGMTLLTEHGEALWITRRWTVKHFVLFLFLNLRFSSLGRAIWKGREGQQTLVWVVLGPRRVPNTPVPSAPLK